MIKKFDFKTFLYINFGILILALGYHLFLIPADLAAGGVTGLSIIINKLLPQLPVGLILIVFNIILFILAFLVIGKEFGGLTVYNSLLFSGLIYLFEIIYPINTPLVDDLLVNLIYGILITGAGMAIVFNHNASTGGTDIIAMIIKRLTNFNIGISLLIADFFIIVAAIAVLGIEIGLYSMLGILINTTVIDKLIAGFNTKYQVAIISEKEELITKFIIEEMNRGVTLMHGVGGYSNEDKKVLHTVIARREYGVIKHMVMEVDPKAFIWVNMVNEVHGEGYTY